ncbi:AfsR/SARP family transcriptional regulator [Lentzea albidocapillata]|uniref:DNA-binding transcriptional activator of the SARP family n=1 Tax=Lentzea albidocapillata TaxID=40571 RepID=A0A1W2F8Q3_9PSEU|nr:BTAD domain-containing putative transcriptional regulator [Lentzea albidocapillata]SMD18319.1 DNA-binding transcriptional activator of the SARP family [Lentzea albidocapillata]
MNDVGIGVLGPFEVTVGGAPRTLGGHRQKRLLALLLLRANTAMSPDQMIDALWDHEPPATARSQVRNAVARLRRDLGSAGAAVVTDSGNYRLCIDDDQADVLRFSRTVKRARELARAGANEDAIKAVRAGLSLWRGTAFAGLDGRVFEAAAASLAEQRLAAQELLIHLRVATGDTTGLVGELFVLTASYPTSEPFVAQLMTALCREGRQADALRAYERLRGRLAEELGVDPGPGLRDLHERALRGDIALTTTPVTELSAVEPRSLPRDLPDFTGRHDEVRNLIMLMEKASDTAVIISAIDGMPGIGKTTLAVRVGHLTRSRFPHGQLFVDLHGHTPGRRPLPPDAALDVLLRGVGVLPEQIPEGLDRRADLWRSVMADRQMLIVLDNAADTAQVRLLLPASSCVRVLVTSRRRLTMLEGASSFSIEVMPPDDAAQLFCRVAAVSPADGPVADVVALCGHLPLAIRIAASRLRSRPRWTVAHLADLLRNESRRLAELSAEDRSVRSAFAVSYDNLSASEQRSFRLLGLLPGGDFGEHAAGAVMDLELPDARRTLEELVDINLLVNRAPGRYLFHDLLRQFARSLCAEDERAKAIGRVVEYYLDLGHTAEQVAHPVGIQEERQSLHPLPDMRTAHEVRSVIDTEHRAIAELIDLAGEHGLSEEIAELASLFGPVLQRQGHLDDALAAYESGLAVGVSLQVKADLYRGLGKSLITARRLGAALRALRTGLALEQKLGNDRGAGRAHNNLGIAHYRLGRFLEARTSFHQSLTLLSEVGTPYDKATPLINLAATHIGLGNYADAISAATEVLAQSPVLNNPHLQAVAFYNLGHAQLCCGDTDAALKNLEQSKTISLEIGATEIEGRNLYTIADCHRQRRDFTAALDGARAALILARRIGNRDIQSHAHVVLGRTHLDLDAPALAAECFHESLRLTADDGDNFTEAAAHDGLARIAYDEQDLPRAEHHWQAALNRAHAGGLPQREQYQRNLADLGTTADRRARS